MMMMPAPSTHPNWPCGHPLTRFLGFPPGAGEEGGSGTSFSVMLRGEDTETALDGAVPAAGTRLGMKKSEPAGWAAPPLLPRPGSSRRNPGVTARAHPAVPAPVRCQKSPRARLEEVGAQLRAWHIRCDPPGGRGANAGATSTCPRWPGHLRCHRENATDGTP